MPISRATLKQALDQWTDWFERTSKDIHLRHLEIKIPSKNALVLIGVRRSGKTHLAVQLAKQANLVTLYFNFEDPIFYEDNSVVHLDTLISVFTEYHQLGKEPAIVILDEIQNINGWERWVRKQVELKQRRIILTGSSAKLLSAELATAIAGRCVEEKVWPLSYQEFLNFSNFTCTTPSQHLAALREYFQFGGFPEVVL